MQRVCKGLIVYARPLFSGVCCLLLSVYFGGTFRTVFGSSGTGRKVCTADLAAAGSFGTEDRVLQFRLQRENSALEVLADQAVGYGLRTDTGIAIVQQKAVSIVIIAALVSSFDSIYKNKVVYAIVKILHHKKRIVLTHNTDLIRLLDGQHKHCFKLYLLNNTDGEVNGFIPLRNREQYMLISLEKLLDAFRTDVPRKVQNVELYLISMIPFMRGYANIANKKDIFEALTQVMHGYKSESVDIAQAYRDHPKFCVNLRCGVE